MTTTRAARGGVIHFPPAIILDSVSVIEAPPPETLPGIAAAVHPSDLLLFSKRLVHAARRRHANPRWQKVNRSRIELARLCLERALSHWAAAMPALPRAVEPAGDDDQHEAMDAPRETKIGLVAEAFHIFGEDAARQLADKLGVAFADCGEEIERSRYRPN